MKEGLSECRSHMVRHTPMPANACLTLYFMNYNVIRVRQARGSPLDLPCGRMQETFSRALAGGRTLWTVTSGLCMLHVRKAEIQKRVVETG